MPGPVSRTLITSHPGVWLAVTATCAPACEWRIAFATRLMTTSRSRTGSTSARFRSAGASTLHAHTARARFRLERAHGVVDEERDVGRLPAETHHAALGVGQRPEVLHEARQHPGLLQHLADLRVVRA